MNFIEKVIEDAPPKVVRTRFPPEPNGYLHIGHAKSICLNFEIAKKYNGTCNLRLDDTNPEKESEEYIQAILRDVEWLGYTPDKLCYASDYFPRMYDYAVQLIKAGLAYVDDTCWEDIKNQRTTGVESVYRDRSVEDNLALFELMRAGGCTDGSRVLRAKIDMKHPNAIMRDPVMYRVKHARHHRTGLVWCIYPLYDYAHCLSDYFEGITHSLCTLEFEIHRELYDWFLSALELPDPKPRQIEFARVNFENVTLSKRVLTEKIAEGVYSGWDDPNIPTLAGLRRKGYTPTAIKEFCSRIGVTKFNASLEWGLLESCLREDLDATATRVMVVKDPLQVELTNYPDGEVELFFTPNHPQRPDLAERGIEFTRTVYIERSDFMENPPKKYYRLRPGGEVRLMSAYVIKCNDVVKEGDKIVKLLCAVDHDTRGGLVEGRKVRGTIHWVSNPVTIDLPSGTALAEGMLKNVPVGTHYQFMRHGYYVKDPVGGFNESVGLRDSWTKKN